MTKIKSTIASHLATVVVGASVVVVDVAELLDADDDKGVVGAVEVVVVVAGMVVEMALLEEDVAVVVGVTVVAFTLRNDRSFTVASLPLKTPRSAKPRHLSPF